MIPSPTRRCSACRHLAQTVLQVCAGPLVGPSDGAGLQLGSFSLGGGQKAGRLGAGISAKAVGHPEESGAVVSTSKAPGSALTNCQRTFWTVGPGRVANAGGEGGGRDERFQVRKARAFRRGLPFEVGMLLQLQEARAPTGRVP